MPPDLSQKAYQAVQSILNHIFDTKQSMLLVYDCDHPLTQLLAQAYQKALPQADVIVFDSLKTENILNAFSKLTAGDLVILVQSNSFRLDEFRIRVHLFRQGLQVIEHPHLNRLITEEFETYLDSLLYDEKYYRTLGHSLKDKLDRCERVTLKDADTKMVFNGPFEPAKLNVGDYSQMKNKGGQFPIGEVFTELKDLTCLNGMIPVFAYGDKKFHVAGVVPAFLLEVKDGIVIKAHKAPDEFLEILDDIKKHEGQVWVRELGFGLNKAMTFDRRVQDVGIYERMCGVHLSLGAKHTIYPKPQFKKSAVKYHVDIFAQTEVVLIDNEVVYKNGEYA